MLLFLTKLELEVKPSDTILDLKSKIKDARGTPSDIQFLFFAGEVLQNERTLMDYNIQDKSELQLMIIWDILYNKVI